MCPIRRLVADVGSSCERSRARMAAARRLGGPPGRSPARCRAPPIAIWWITKIIHQMIHTVPPLLPLRKINNPTGSFSCRRTGAGSEALLSPLPSVAASLSPLVIPARQAPLPHGRRSAVGLAAVLQPGRVAGTAGGHRVRDRRDGRQLHDALCGGGGHRCANCGCLTRLLAAVTPGGTGVGCAWVRGAIVGGNRCGRCRAGR